MGWADAITGIERKHGKGSIFRVGDSEVVPVEVFSTGDLKIDHAIGVGGIPRGRITEVYGPESSGKTTLCLHVIAEAQAKGEKVAFIDAEHALDLKYAEKLGVNVDELYVAQPDTGEQALDILDALIKSGEAGVIVVDSVAALVPRAELEGDMGDSHIGLQARLMSQAMRKISGIIRSTNTAVIFTNQLREKVGVMFGSPETTSGGRALKFYASLRIDMRPKARESEGGEVTGRTSHVKIVKNKVAAPFRECDVVIVFNKGFYKYATLVDLGVDYGIIEKSGAWYTVPGYSKPIQGTKAVIAILEEDVETADIVEAAIREKLNA